MEERDKITIGVAPDAAAGGVDAKQIVAEIVAEVERKRAAGAYDDPRIARAERSNILLMKDGDEFVSRYLDCLRDLTQVDINDFEIREKRGGFAGKILAKFKRAIWKLLKFYTYRMWSQQNQANALLLSALEAVASKQKQEIDALKKEIEKIRRLED